MPRSGLPGTIDVEERAAAMRAADVENVVRSVTISGIKVDVRGDVVHTRDVTRREVEREAL